MNSDAADRFGEQRVDAAAIDFLRDQVDADEDGDEQAEQRRRGQAEVLDDLDVLPRGQLADQDRRADQQHREEDEIVEHAVAHRLAEHRHGDAARRRSSAAPLAPSPICRDAPDEEVLERLAQRIERDERRARGRQLARACARAVTSGGRSMA